MGKQKRQRRKPHKENPTGLPSEQDFDEETEDLEETKEQALLRVLEQVSSGELEDKICALETLETMSMESRMADKIAKNKIAKIIGPFLLDEKELVRAATASALKNIAENGGEDSCRYLLQDDVMTPLITLLKKNYADWKPSSDPSKKVKVDQETHTLTEAVGLLWTLGERDELVIKRSNDENVLSILIQFLDLSTYGEKLTLAAIQCMITLSEDNPTAISELKKRENTLMNFLDWKSKVGVCYTAAIRTLSAGLLMNLNSSFTSETFSLSSICKIISILSETLSIDVEKEIGNVTSSMKKEKCFSKSSQLKLRELNITIAMQRQALEFLANLCTDDQESDADSDLDDSDEYDVDEMEVDPVEDKSINSYSNIPVEMIEVITSTGLVKKVWDMTREINEDALKVFKKHHLDVHMQTYWKLRRCRAFLCLNNLFSILDVDTLGGADSLYRLWTEIGKVVFTDANPNDIDLLESATSAMRAALQKLAEAKANVFQQLTITDLQPIFNGERQCDNPNVRANLLRILGSLTLILLNGGLLQTQELIIKHVSLFLLETCTKENEVWVIAECLDAIMDIFAEDETDTLAGDISLVEKLQALVPILKSKIRQQKQKLGDNALVVSTVKTNLHRFIKYKGQRVAKLKM